MPIGLYGPEYLQFQDGGPAAEVQIFIFLPGTKTKAILYSDKTGLHTGPNPLWSDRRGEVVFFAEIGQYDLFYGEPEPDGTTFEIQITGDDVVSADEYTHVQSVASDIWTVHHFLNTRPSVVVEESINVPDDISYPAIRHPDLNTTELRWGYAASGRATLRR
jgi:hypothetical protein